MSKSTHNIVLDGEPLTVEVEYVTLGTPPPPLEDYPGPAPKRLNKNKDCACGVAYANDTYICPGARCDTYVYCAKCGCLKDIMGS